MNFDHTKQRQSGLLIVLLLLVFVRGLIYISLFPPWLAPDEPAHFEAIRIIGQLKQSPTKEIYYQTPMLPEMLEIFENFRIWQESLRTPTITLATTSLPLPLFIDYYPPISHGSVVSAQDYPLTYHSLLAPILALVRGFELSQQIYFLRFVSLFLTLITIAVCWFFARAIFPGTVNFAVATVSFLVFLPTHLHINTSINTDVAATVTVSLFFLILAKLMLSQRWWLWLSLVVIMAFALSIKPTTFFIVPTMGVAVLVMLFKKYQGPRKILYLTLIMMLLLTQVGAVILFQATGARRSLFSVALSLFQSTDLTVFIPTWESLSLYAATGQFGFITFWGVYGWANIHIPFAWVWVLAGVIAIFTLGGVMFFGKHVVGAGQTSGYLSKDQQDIMIVLLCSVIFAIMGMYAPIIATQTGEWGPPGRYFLPAILPTALLLFLGFQQLLPDRLKFFAVPVWVTAWIFFDTATILYVILPIVYG